MRQLLTGGVLFVCSTVLAFALAQVPASPATAIERDGIDQLLADFAATTATLDVDRAEKLFLPPDGTAAGQNRQGHLSELRKDWKRAKESGAAAGPSVRFINTRKIIRTQMLISGPGGAKESQVGEVEFVVAFTRDGWRIVSMNTEPAR